METPSVDWKVVVPLLTVSSPVYVPVPAMVRRPAPVLVKAVEPEREPRVSVEAVNAKVLALVPATVTLLVPRLRLFVPTKVNVPPATLPIFRTIFGLLVSVRAAPEPLSSEVPVRSKKRPAERLVAWFSTKLPAVSVVVPV